MPPAGDETLARWREAGEWWADQPPREVRRFLDAQGVRREEIQVLAPPSASAETPPRLAQDRENKVARACGFMHEPNLTVFAQRKPKPGYAALHAVSGYSFGRGAMHAANIAASASFLEIGAVLLADSFSLAGAFEFCRTAWALKGHPLIGASLEMAEGGTLVLVARNKDGYRSLSRLITECHLGEPRLYPLCDWERLERHTAGLLCLTGGDDGPVNRLLVRGEPDAARETLDRLVGLYGRRNVFVQVESSFLPWQIATNRRLLELAEAMRVLPVAGGPITHVRPEQFPAQDTLTCIETLCAIEEVVGRKPLRAPGQPKIQEPPRRALNAERYLRTKEEMALLFPDRPDLIANTWRVVERCERDVLPPRTQMPAATSNDAYVLRQEVWRGAARRYTKLSHRHRACIKHELDRITRLGYASHFLIAWDMCNWAASQGILHSGRGSVVDSVAAYCLGLSRIDAFEHNLHFDRFLPRDGSKRPDIDIDFEADRRDEVRNYLAKKYGDAHVATVAAVGTYGTRGIVREVGKVMGIPPESLDYLAKRLHGSVSPHRLQEAIQSKPELRNSGIPLERFRWVFRLAEELMDMPRNMRAHSSGVVISREPIADTVPVMLSAVEDVKIIQWDKRSAKRCFDKFDVLCLRGNDVLSDTQRRIRLENPDFRVVDISLKDENTYRAMRSGELIGIPQSASPAMRQAHVRLQTQNLKDAGIVQAAIRPGVGGAVKLNDLVKRRRYDLKIHHTHSLIESILKPTYGIVVFQEQIDHLLQDLGGFSCGQAEEIREKIQRDRKPKEVESTRDWIVNGVRSQNYSEAVAREVYELVAVFKGYGFAEGHALSFAEVSIRSVWCQQNYPSQYFAALLDAQPAGYYGPCTLVNEARARNVRILGPDINRSDLKFTVEDILVNGDPRMKVPNGGIRVSLRQIGAISEALRERIVAGRSARPYRSFFDAVARIRPHRDELEQLVLCGAFDSLEPNRRALLWAIPLALQYAALAATPSSLPISLREPALPSSLPDLSPIEKAIRERVVLDLDVEHHLMAFERERVRAKGGITAREAGRLPHGTKAFVVGNPIRLRFPPTESGKRVMFFDLEDESGLLNVTCFDEVYQRDGHTVICSPYITLRGEAQNRDGHIAFLAHRIYPFEPSITREPIAVENLPIATADFLVT